MHVKFSPLYNFKKIILVKLGKGKMLGSFCFRRLLLSLFHHWVSSSSSRPHGLQHARPPCPSLSPRVCPSSWPLSWWCHPTISSSAALFSFCLQSLVTTVPQISITKLEYYKVKKNFFFKVNVIFNEKHVGKLCGYSKHVGRTEFLGANKEGIYENINFLEW